MVLVERCFQLCHLETQAILFFAESSTGRRREEGQLRFLEFSLSFAFSCQIGDQLRVHSCPTLLLLGRFKLLASALSNFGLHWAACRSCSSPLDTIEVERRQICEPIGASGPMEATYPASTSHILSMLTTGYAQRGQPARAIYRDGR